MSPDGNYVAAIMQNGSNKSSSHPNYHKGSVLSVFRIDGTKLTLGGEGRIRRLGTGRGVEQGRQDAACPVDGGQVD